MRHLLGVCRGIHVLLGSSDADLWGHCRGSPLPPFWIPSSRPTRAATAFQGRRWGGLSVLTVRVIKSHGQSARISSGRDGNRLWCSTAVAWSIAEKDSTPTAFRQIHASEHAAEAHTAHASDESDRCRFADSTTKLMLKPVVRFRGDPLKFNSSLLFRWSWPDIGWMGVLALQPAYWEWLALSARRLYSCNQFSIALARDGICLSLPAGRSSRSHVHAAAADRASGSCRTWTGNCSWGERRHLSGLLPMRGNRGNDPGVSSVWWQVAYRPPLQRRCLHWGSDRSEVPPWCRKHGWAWDGCG